MQHGMAQEPAKQPTNKLFISYTLDILSLILVNFKLVNLLNECHVLLSKIWFDRLSAKM